MSENNEFQTDLVPEEQETKCEAVINRERFENNIQNMWGYSDVGIEAKRAAMTMLSTKTGMYARIPLVCKAEGCPYAETCSLLAYNLAPLSEPCPIETAQIEIRYAGYEKDFDLDKGSFTDKNLVADLINHDIMLERCKALLNKEGVLVTDVVAGIAENGEVYTRPEVSKHWEAYERIKNKRDNTYNLMMATRKDKKGEGEQAQSITQMVSEMMHSTDFIVEERPDGIIDVDPKE